ncbi:midasin [Favolaschia claudopus]|uniref:Midasin n=1 Tax=Favolaschia claudopus TaxID=2862362 RepID=A0AAW0DCL3_9AGAR
MAFPSAIHDPLAINLRGQTAVLISRLPSDSPHGTTLESALAQPLAQFLNALSTLLSLPELTTLVATIFRPILLDLSARWLDGPQNTEEQLVALCYLLEVHEELFPVLHGLLQRPMFVNGPLAFVLEADSPLSIDVPRLHRLLLAYYRILQANRELPLYLSWSLAPLSCLIWTPELDNAVRLLAIRCYSLQSGMGEGEREKMESEILGQSGGVDCPLEYGRNADGTPIEMDGWVMPVFEVQRIREMRRQIVTEPHNYYEGGQNESWPLSPRLVDVHGVLLFRENGFPSVTSPLISTPTTVEALRTLATHISLRLPTLISSPPSSGKTLLLSHMAELLHPGIKNQIIHIHLADTSLDPRSLLGSYVSSPTRPGTFEWQEGVLVRSMRQGRWVVFEDIDRGSNEVLGVLKPLVESLGPGKWIGQRASLDVPSRGKIIAADGFAIFATRSAVPSRTGTLPPPLFYGSHKFHEILLPSPTSEDLQTIIDSRFPRLAGRAARAFIRLWEAVRLRDLETFCTRIQRLLPSNAMDVDSDATDAHTTLSSIFPNTTLREDLYLESRDVFFGAGTTTASARVHLENIARVIGEHLGLDPERGAWVLNGRVPDLTVEKDVNGRTVALSVGRTRLLAHEGKVEMAAPPARPFAMHRPAVMLLSRIATAVSIGEPVLLTGETGTGKTSVITHLASVLRRPLISLNLSHQTESADLVGGFKPIDARVPGSALHERFLELFGGTFSRRKNEKFEAEVRKAVGEGRWKRAVGLWKESIRLAKERIQAKATVDPMEDPNANGDTPRKRRKVDHALNVSEADWAAFEKDVGEFEVQHVHAKGKFAFGFVEGPLVKALRSGEWVLLDETLECISSLLHSPTASITLTEQGSLEPVPRHPDFRLFACMNPATDVGKKDLPPNIRSRFIEIDVPPPDADRETLLSIVNQYIGDKAVGDKAAIMNVAEFYAAVKQLADTRQIADGSNHKPHYSMRTLARALTFAADIASTYSLRRAIWEGCLMAFTMVLDAPSAEIVTALAQKHLLMGVRNPRSMLTKEPSVPQGRSADEFVKFGPFYLEKGPSPSSLAEDYILTPSVETKLIDLARIILTRRFPVLIEGPTSSGKTSSVEYLAKRTGHRFIRINNHEHTDIQEYLGSYVSDPVTGKLVFKDGLLVTALRNGDWIVLDELNLAPTDVLEALNRLLDDNRELVIPETQEVVRPHPHFMLFATQNPPGLYAGRKVLSRAFRNRFLEVHFEDVPQAELETILCQRCRIAPSYGKKIVNVFRDLQKRRQFGRVFETKQSFATLRDLFRWAGRDAIGYQELAENGYMLLAERARREDDKVAVKEVIESVMGVKIDEKAIYNLHSADVDFHTYLGCPIPSSSPNLVWTSAMQRLFILVSRALRFNEPVLLVGETGSGKTSVCQIFADASSQVLHGLNCHQNTETADLIGGLRPVRNKSAREAEVYTEGMDILQHLGLTPTAPTLESVMHAVKAALESPTVEDLESRSRLEDVRRKCLRLASIFEWHDGPLVDAMRNGDVFLLDEISLADDSVLERLNSVLEPGRTLVLAERGGNDLEYPAIRAADSFKLVATMNPGGDYGKKELSPALRNRFTEIWVPPVNEHQDLELIIDHTWKVEPLRAYTSKVLGFTEWLSAKIGDTSMSSLRDIMAWVAFSNSVYPVGADEGIAANEIFHHAAHMTFLDGLGSLPQLSGYSREAIVKLKDEALAMLHGHVPIYDSSNWIQLGTFAIPRGPLEPSLSTFNLRAPTTQDNAMRVVRACQGSPGVGKTSLVNALAHLAGHRLCRINLSDQTDLIDLFGSDLPFAWKDAEFLTALQQGHWAVLEGLNAVLDHRGTVYIPELGRSFSRHPAFRGGRKGLPKSFVNRFTKVYVEELTPNDLLLVCQHLFPAIAPETLQGMISFNTTLNDEISFNLRDVLRWAALLSALPALTQPSELLRSVYLERFRDPDDRSPPNAIQEFDKRPRWAISAQHLQFGGFCFPRQNYASPRRPGLEAVGHWARNSGKTELVRALANFSGRPLHEIALNTATDTMDIIGSFEQVDDRGHVLGVVDSLLSVLKSRVRSVNGSRPSHLLLYDQLSKARKDASTGGDPTAVLLLTTKLINELRLVAVDADENAHLRKLQDQVEQLVSRRDGPGRFEWVDGPLIRAMREGEWLLLDGANLCNPSVLDRLNSLCEVNGFLTLSERGYVDGSVQILRPHPGFRIFMCVDPQHGELSRAMRNRGIEINLPSQPIADDSVVLQDHLRLPLSLKWPDVKTFDTRRRGLVHDIHSTETLATISGRVLDQDSQSSSLLDRVSLLSGASSAVYQFAARTIPAAYTLHFQRFAVQAGGLEVFRNLLRAVPTPGLLPATSSVAEAYARSWGLPLDFVCAQALDLNVSLYLNSEAAESIEARINPEHAYSNARALKEIDTVIETVRNLAVAALSGMTRDLPANMASIHLASRSLQYANHLQRARGTTHFDYSAVQAISSWLSDALEGCPSNYLPLAQRVRVLRETVALSTGLGMNEMWSKFSADGDFHPSAAMMALDESARRLSSRESAETQALRSQCFELICLSPLQESASVEEKKAFDLLHGDLLKRLQAASSSPVESGAQCEFDSLIPQLGILASCTATQNLVNKIERFLQIERLQPSSSLNRLVVYQHLSWTLKAQKDVSSLTLRLQLQWLSNLWSTVADDGPAMFLRPLEIRSTIASCNMKSGSLTTLAAFERNMQRRLALVLFHCEDNTPRVEQLARVLRQGVQLVAACFAPEADEIRPTLGSIELDLKQALTALDRLKSMPFQAAFKLHLRPHLQRLVSPSHSRQQRVVDLGSCWMGLARTIFELFVPDAPVDPAAIQNCAVEFWKHLRQSLSEQLHLHTQLELSTTGNSENIAVRYLRAQLAEADDHLQHISSHPLRVNISRLHLFWSEVAQFLNHIISRSKTDILVASLRDGEESAILRENVVQQSMAGFSQRLDSVYPEFADINTPLKLAVFYFRIGLRLVASTFILSDPACDYAVDLSQSLVAFPSARASAAILTDPESRPLVVTPFRHLLLNLAAVVVDARAGIDSATYADLIQTTYEQAQRLWRIDRAREGEAAAASVSLYRHKVDYNDEREFLLLFPQFENIEALAVDGTLASRLESIEVSQLAELHHTLALRKNTLETLLHTRFPSLSERLDAESLHFQLALIRDPSSTDSQPYNFYAKKAVAEWPDQMVLQHLVGRCDTVLALDLSSPVAKTADWEIYANRHNTLKDHQSALTNLIVEWRRLELACWKSFADGTADWWFHIYDATICGSLDAAERERNDQATTLTDYLSKLIPLPLGHFEIFCQTLHRVRPSFALKRGVLEKELRGFIKLASWKDINVQALKASAQRTHHQLYKLIRKFRDVLRQPVSDQLRQHRRLDLHQSSESFDALPLSPFPSNSSGSVLAPARLQDLTSTFKKFADFLRTRIQPFIGSHSALVVDNVAVDIIVATKELAAITITATPAEKREKQIKALMVRKRKAWSDLLKELKRAGFTVNMKADILRQQSDVLWIREQPLLQCPLWTIAPTVDKGEEYYNRLNNIMPTLRASLSGHHPDLVTRDLQKGVMFVESVFAMAVECRTRLADAFDVYEKLQHLTERLHRTAASGQIISATACSLFDSFQPTPRVADPLFEQVRSIELSTQTLRARTETHEEAIVADAIQHFTQTSVALQTMAEEHPRLQYLLLPNTDGVIDLLLVHVQSILSICPVDSMEEPEEQDRYIEHDLSPRSTQSLQFVAQPHDIQTRLQRFLPFLDLYLQVAQRQLISHSEWTKALFKLDFVLCSVTQTIAKDGFCRPPDADDAGDSAGTSEVSGGMGLGAGEGSQNVSKEIEDESQVEGLKGDDEDGNDPKGEENQDDSNSEQGSEADPEEQLGDLDASDPSAVDEKLWGDEQGPKDSSEKDDKTDQDHSEQKSGDSEVVAKEGEQQSPPANAEDDAAVEGEEGPRPSPMRAGLRWTTTFRMLITLDLPDDMDLGTGEEMAEDMEMEDGLEDETMADVEEEPAPDTETSKEQANPDDRPADDAPEPMDGQEAEPPVQATEDIDGESPENEDEPDDNAVARPDVTAGEGEADPNTDENENGGESAETGQAGRSAGVSGKDASAAEENAAAEQGAPEPSKPSDQPPGASESEVAGASTEGPQEGQAQSQPNMQLESNPLRSLGDALKEIRQRFNEIMDAPQGDTPREQPVPTEEEAPTGAEYLRPDDADHDMQALGPAGEEQVAKLNELTLLDAEQQSGAKPNDKRRHPEIQHLHDGASLQQPRPDTEGAMVHDATHDSARRTAPNDTAVPTADVDIEDADANANVELELRQWQTTGMADEGAERIWRLYESLTHDLAYALCEQLRLILEPTLATRLKGDYRTGEAAEHEEDHFDKIWLRRTRPSQREYQVLISLDDSKSMAESHSVHLAFETLAPAGDVAIAKFGERVDILHGFDEGPFTDQAGTKLMSAFRFDQKATDVLALVETSLRVLEAARERAGDGVGLQFIISDGMCQDHERLRTVLRKAEEQRVMIVFVIVDSLHSQAAAGGSILTMEKAEYKNVDGRMELQLQRYLDSFPFEYYVVLRNVEALPDAVFERVSEE